MSEIDLMLIVGRLLIGGWLLWRIPGPDRLDGDRPPCAVVIPARNETLALRATLAAAIPQLRPGDELVVIDDHSEDDTASIARAAGVRVLTATALPAGWTGKAFACWTGAGATSAPVICFLDADTKLAPGALDRLVRVVAGEGGMASAQPWHEVVGWEERASAFFNLLAIMGTGVATPLAGRLRPRAAFGPVLLVRRADYEVLDGHRAVAGDVLDDVGLAARWRDAGRSVHLFAGRRVASFRMYPGGWRSLLEGWAKNIAVGAGAVRRAELALAVAWLTLPVQAIWWLARAVDGAGATEWTIAIGLYAVVVGQLWWMLRRVGSFGWSTALLFPVPLLLFALVFARSVMLVVLGRSTPWKGRPVATRRPGRSVQTVDGSGSGSGSGDEAAGTNKCSR